MNNEKLINDYLKGNYNKFKNSKINLGIIIFGYIYLFYRKLYGYGVILMIINIILYYFKLYWVIVIINLILGLVFNKLYLKIINNRIEKYKLEYMDNKLVIEKCKKDNTDIMLAFIISIVTIGLLLVYYIYINSYNTRIGSMYLNIDKSWDKSDYSNKYYDNYTYNDSDNYCSLTLEILNSTIIDDFVNDAINSYDGESKIQDVTINNRSYKLIKFNNDSSFNYIYVTSYMNSLYVLLFDIYKDNGVCNNYYKDIINSVVIKD